MAKAERIIGELTENKEATPDTPTSNATPLNPFFAALCATA